MKVKKFYLIFLMVLFVSMLFACGSNNTEIEKTNIANLNTGYKINFVSNGGSTVDLINVKDGEPATKPEDPTYLGYEFLGWYTEQTFDNKFNFDKPVDKDTTLYARWKLINYTIKYYLNGGNNVSNPTQYNVKTNNIKLKDPTYEGKYFAGWYLDENFTTKITEINTKEAKNLELYAKWSDEVVLPEYTITYMLDGGENGDNPSIYTTRLGIIPLESATKTGSTFDGWYLDPNFESLVTEIDTSIEKNITLYAKWTQGEATLKYMIYYHLSGGTNGKNITYYTSDSEPFTLLNPSKLSCTFDGWYLDPLYETPIKAIDNTLSGDLDLYAKWIIGITEFSYSFDLGLGKEYTLYQISDTHVIAGNDATAVENENRRVGVNGIGGSRESYAKQFNEAYDITQLCTSSLDNYYRIMNYVNSKNPDGICITGDLVDYYSSENWTFLYNELTKIPVPYIWTIGNHENPSESFGTLPGIDTPDFSVLEFADFKIISLDNTNKDLQDRYCYSANQLELLTAEIAKGKPIIIIQHTPIVNDYNSNTRVAKCGEYYYMSRNNCDKTTADVIDLICNSSTVKLVLAGHIHGETIAEIAPGKSQITCSSALMGVVNRITIY